MNLSYYC